MPLYDGGNIFGLATNVAYGPIPCVRQENQYFGLDGTQSLHGGTRGGQIQVHGVLSGSSYGDVIAAEALINSYVDGIARTFVDNYGRSFNAVIIVSELTPDAMGIKPSTQGFSMAYTVMLQRLR